MSKIFKSFIIGCGHIAGYSNNHIINDYTHGYAYKHNPNIKISGCMDIDGIKSRAFASEYKCEAFDNYQDGIKTTMSEIISVCTPDDTHHMIVKSLLEMDLNIKLIFLEKPACSSIVEMEELIALSDKKKIDIVINHTRRFDKKYQIIKKNISEGIYGDFINGVITYYSGWEHNGVHVIDTLSFLFDEDIKINHLKKISDSPYPEDPTLDGELLLSKSQSKIQLLSFDESYYQLFEFDLRFANTRIRIEDFGSRIILETKEVNNIGENILVLSNHQFSDSEDIPMLTAVEIIIKRLQENDTNILNGYRLIDITDTMKTIWEGKKIYEI